MSQAMATPPPRPPGTRVEDSIIVLDGATWADYQRVLELRGESASPRLTYLEGTLELTSRSGPHLILKSMIGRLLETWCLEHDVDISPYGSWTLENKEADRGIEPDECYVLGDVADPAQPDLAIEVIWTSGSIKKLEVYRKLGVREVWIWRDGRIGVHVLEGERYEPSPKSTLLPDVDLDLLLSFVDEQPMTRAVKRYREALRERRGP